MARKTKTKKQRRDRIQYLRRKLKDGAELTEGETRQLERWEAARAAGEPEGSEDSSGDEGDPQEQDSDAGEAPEAPPPADTVTVQDPAVPVADAPPAAATPPLDPVPISPPPKVSAPPPPRMKAGPLPKPPRVDPVENRERDAPKGRGDPDWKGKYREAAKGSGREATVGFIAGQWIAILKAMSDDIKYAGIAPMVDVESAELRAVIMLTVDELLPERVQLKHSHQAAFGTTVLVGQRYWHRKEIAAKHAQAKERAAHAKRREQTQAERAANEVPQDDPPPPPSEPGIAVEDLTANGSALAVRPGFDPDQVI